LDSGGGVRCDGQKVIITMSVEGKDSWEGGTAGQRQNEEILELSGNRSVGKKILTAIMVRRGEVLQRGQRKFQNSKSPIVDGNWVVVENAS